MGGRWVELESVLGPVCPPCQGRRGGGSAGPGAETWGTRGGPALQAMCTPAPGSCEARRSHRACLPPPRAPAACSRGSRDGRATGGGMPADLVAAGLCTPAWLEAGVGLMRKAGWACGEGWVGAGSQAWALSCGRGPCSGACGLGACVQHSAPDGRLARSPSQTH